MLHQATCAPLVNKSDQDEIRRSQDTNSNQPKQSLERTSQCPYYTLLPQSPPYYDNVEATQQKDYKTFYPGIYQYHFEILLDCTYPESIKLPSGTVLWELHALVERAEPLKWTISVTKGIPIIRVPNPSSWEVSQPISVTRIRKNQLGCRMIITSHIFVIGSKIPVQITVMPLKGIRCFSISVFLIEEVDYITDPKKGTRFGRRRYVLLYESEMEEQPRILSDKFDNPTLCDSNSTKISSSMVRTSPSIQEIQGVAQQDQPVLASREVAGGALENLASDLESVNDLYRFEADLNIPTCSQMRANKEKQLNPSTAWRAMQVRHWIKV